MPRTVPPRTRTLIVVVTAVSALLAVLAAPADAGATEEYATLGDSFASGNGTRNPDLDLACYRSSDAYGPLIAEDRPDTTLVFPACQGAETADIVKGQAAELSGDTDWVTVSIGGNDVDFIELVLNCINHFDEAQCLAAAEDTNAKIETKLPGRLDDAYAAIGAAAPNATVMVVGYPRFFGDDVSCLDADGISPTEAEALNGVADNLDAKIGERAGSAGLTYVSVMERFTGHDVCADDPYINGKLEPVVNDAAHPSPAGYRDGFLPLIRDIMG
jgi:lysophospholipase L1-like esterase